MATNNSNKVSMKGLSLDEIHDLKENQTLLLKAGKGKYMFVSKVTVAEFPIQDPGHILVKVLEVLKRGKLCITQIGEKIVVYPENLETIIA